MGFGGSVSAMIASMKNNKRTRKNTFDKLDKYQKEELVKLHFNNTANEKDLEKIRQTIKKENRISFIKNCISYILTLILLYFAAKYFYFL